jgi:hypothetical protein
LANIWFAGNRESAHQGVYMNPNNVQYKKNLRSVFGHRRCGFMHRVFYKNDTWTVYKQNPDWRSAASYLIKEKGALDELVIFNVTPADTLIYYLRRQGIESFKVIRVKRTRDLTRILSKDNFLKCLFDQESLLDWQVQ